jgi:Spy/CpxP family protein refolding chaperone
MNRTGYKKVIVFVMVVMFLGGQALGAGEGRRGRRGYGFGPGAYGNPETDSFRYGRGLTFGQHHGPAIERALHRLGLTEQQTERIENILESARDKSESVREAIANATKAFHTAIAESAGETAIREAAVNLGKAIGDQAVSRATTMASIKEVLNEEQLERLEKIKDSESRGVLDRAEFRGRGMHRPNQHGALSRGHDRPGRGAGVFGRGHDGPDRGMGRFGRGPERQGRGFGEGPGRQGRGSDENPRAGLRIDRLIEQVDTNNDGTLTAEELEAFKKNVEDKSR